jgi:hypothetical protein
LGKIFEVPNQVSGKLQIRTKTEHDGIHVFFSGPLNEDASLQIVQAQPDSKLHLHLDELTMINSAGIRKWLQWVGGHIGESWQVWGCPPHLINQLNMIQGFLPTKAKVQSFYVVYYSVITNEQFKLLIDRDKWDQENAIEVPVDSLGNPMEPDFLEDTFFKFRLRH